MKYSATCLGLLGMMVGSIGCLVAGLDGLLIFSSAAAIPLAAGLTIRLIRQRNIYIAIFLFSQFCMYLFTLYVFINEDLVIEVPEFDFSVFTNGNLRTALMAFAVTVALIVSISLLFARKRSTVGSMDIPTFLAEVMGRIAFLSSVNLTWLLLLSFVSAATFFIIGPSVIEMPYPEHVFARPFPDIAVYWPALLAAVILAAAHAKALFRSRHRSDYRILLFFARINFCVTPVLTLMIVSARARYTFMWLTLALLEVYLARREKTTLLWGLIYTLLAYLAYTAWPFLRAHWASMDTPEALYTALQYALWMKHDTLVAGIGEMIDVGKFPMIGQSLFHLLSVIELENNGDSLGGSTFLNLLPQALPEFLDGLLWERPLNDNWKIPYSSGGGFLAIANAYWNGGMAVMAIFVACTSTAFLYFDNHLVRQHTSAIYKWTYYLSIPIVTTQLFYGIQGLARISELLVFVILLEKLLGRRNANKRPLAGVTPRNPQTPSIGQEQRL